MTRAVNLAVQILGILGLVCRLAASTQGTHTHKPTNHTHTTRHTRHEHSPDQRAQSRDVYAVFALRTLMRRDSSERGSRGNIQHVEMSTRSARVAVRPKQASGQPRAGRGLGNGPSAGTHTAGARGAGPVPATGAGAGAGAGARQTSAAPKAPKSLTLFIANCPGARSVCAVHALANWRVSELKQAVFDCTAVPQSVQALWHGRHLLAEDARTLADYMVGDAAQIRLSLRLDATAEQAPLDEVGLVNLALHGPEHPVS